MKKEQAKIIGKIPIPARLRRSGQFAVKVSGNCMQHRPGLGAADGDIAVAHPAEPGELRPGDLIIFHSSAFGLMIKELAEAVSTSLVVRQYAPPLQASISMDEVGNICKVDAIIHDGKVCEPKPR